MCVPSAMPVRGSEPDVLVDTSAAIALLVEDHEFHAETVEAVGSRRLGLSGHAAFETYSVVTRLPGGARRTTAVVAELLAANFPATRFLSAAGAARLMKRLPRLGIAGGSVYDALVAAVAVEHGLTLATRDQRALDVYRALDVDLEVLG